MMILTSLLLQFMVLTGKDEDQKRWPWQNYEEEDVSSWSLQPCDSGPFPRVKSVPYYSSQIFTYESALAMTLFGFQLTWLYGECTMAGADILLES